MNETRTGPSEHLPSLNDIITMLRKTDPDSWWAGPTFRSPCGTKHCVLSHVYEAYGEEGFYEFQERFDTSYHIGGAINDAPSERYPQPHPKDRVIAYLEAMERGEELTTYESMDAHFKRQPIYLAGPMTGLSEYNYPAFTAEAQRLRDAGYTVLSPHEIDDHEPGSKPYEWYIEQGLAKLGQCDVVALLPGWEDSRGVAIELEWARKHGLSIVPVETLQ